MQYTDGTYADLTFLSTKTAQPLQGTAPATGSKLYGDWNRDGIMDELVFDRDYNKMSLSNIGELTMTEVVENGVTTVVWTAVTSQTGISLLNMTVYSGLVYECWSTQLCTGVHMMATQTDSERFLEHPLEQTSTNTYGGLTFDWDNDLAEDIFIVNYNQPNQLFMGSRTVPGAFTEDTTNVITRDSKPSIGAITGDYNGDGATDIIVLNSGEPNQLFLNNPDDLGSFADGSHILMTQQIAFDPANVGAELANWGSKSMPFVCEIDVNPGRAYQSCADTGDGQVLVAICVQIDESSIKDDEFCI